MKKAEYEVFEALNPFFGDVQKGLWGLVDGKHYFDTFAEDAILESRYHFPRRPGSIMAGIASDSCHIMVLPTIGGSSTDSPAE